MRELQFLFKLVLIGSVTLVGLSATASSSKPIYTPPPYAWKPPASFEGYEAHRHPVYDNKIPYWSVALDEVADRKCQNQIDLSSKTINNWINQYIRANGNELQDREISGTQFKAQPRALLDIYQVLVQYDDLNLKNTSAEMYDDFAKLVKAKTKTNCESIKCAVSKLFGDRVGQLLIYLQARYKFNGSPFTYHNGDLFNERELIDVIEAISLIPEPVFIKKQRQVIRFAREMVMPIAPSAKALYQGWAVPETDRVIVFDNWMSLSRQSQIQIIMHELGHMLDHTYGSVSMEPVWLDISGWHQPDGTSVLGGWKWTNFDPGVSYYGMSRAPWEDFAETVTLYRFRPERLKIISPEKYEVMKRVIFRGIEFTTDLACQGAPTSIDEGLKLYTRVAGNLDEKNLNQKLKTQCPEQMFKYFAADENHDINGKDLRDCGAKAVKSALKTQAQDQDPHVAQFLKPLRERGETFITDDHVTEAIYLGNETLKEDISRLIAHTDFSWVEQRRSTYNTAEKYCEFWVMELKKSLRTNVDGFADQYMPTFDLKTYSEFGRIANDLCEQNYE